MKVTDLRIGNYIYYNNEIIKIIGIKGNKIYWGNDYYDSIMLNHNLFPPIPLTEEIFLNNGFETNQIEFSNYNEDRDDNICGVFEDGVFYYTAGEGIHLSIGIKYVHKFQNLYYALTGEELEINL